MEAMEDHAGSGAIFKTPGTASTSFIVMASLPSVLVAFVDIPDTLLIILPVPPDPPDPVFPLCPPSNKIIDSWEGASRISFCIAGIDIFNILLVPFYLPLLRENSPEYFGDPRSRLIPFFRCSLLKGLE